MNRTITTVTAAALALAFAVAPAAAQNLPPPGNVNPGSLYSGAEQSGAPNQARSYLQYGYGGFGGQSAYYGPVYDGYGYSAYAAQPGMSFGPFGYAPGYGPYGLGTGGANAIGSNN